MSPEHRKIISETNKGNKWALGMRHTDEWKAANRLRFKGKKHTPEQIARAAAGKRASFEANPTIYRGERNGRAKLTEDQVREIRRLYAEGKHSQADLGQLFDLNQRTISQIVRRKLWKFVT